MAEMSHAHKVVMHAEADPAPYVAVFIQQYMKISICIYEKSNRHGYTVHRRHMKL